MATNPNNVIEPDRPLHPMTWEDLCADPRFQDLPYKIEWLHGGVLVMSPHTNAHSDWQMVLVNHLKQYAPPGWVSVEYAVVTEDGVRVADVVWLPHEQAQKNRTQGKAVPAPDICIEVVSDSNTKAGLFFKAALYFQAGAKEVWICTNGALCFLTPEGKKAHSTIAPDFPTLIEL